MEASKVFFTNMRVKNGDNLLKKLDRLMRAAGIESIDFDKRFTAIKMHFGEPGNLTFLRPNFAKVVADLVKEKGGIPFLTDCNVLYVGKRTQAVDHLNVAAENGFSPASCGCPVIIADGLKGTDEALVPLEGTTYVKEAKIGHAIMDADIVISLTHFKGHEATGFGGALKNLGMGCGSRAGKWNSIAAESLRLIRSSAAAAAPASAHASRTPLCSMRNTERTSTRKSVSAAAAVSAHVIFMLFTAPTMWPWMSFA